MHFEWYLTYPVMKKLSKANWLFLFYLVANKSENHYRKLAHCTLWRHKMAALELQTCPKCWHQHLFQSAIKCYWSDISIKVWYIYNQVSSNTHMNQESKCCENYGRGLQFKNSKICMSLGGLQLKRGWLSSQVVAFHFPEKMAMREEELWSIVIQQIREISELMHRGIAITI